jgi:hypothetical protein
MGPSIRRREWIVALGKAAGACSLGGLGFLLGGCGGGNYSGPPPPPGDGYSGTDDQLLEEITKAAFQFFWEQADPNTGQVKDRAFAAGGNDNRTVSSIAATGFGLTALCIGDTRGYQPASAIITRVQATLNFLLSTMQPMGMNGFFYHFVDMTTGTRAFTSEVSSIDTAILLCGVLMCRQHFSQDPQIPGLATQIYNNVNFSWMLNGGTTLSMGWTPESRFFATRWDTYSELMMLYLLAIASPTDPIPASSWAAWARPSFTYQGLMYISSDVPLFTHQYSHAWFDFRNKKDAFANYFQNSITATMAHRLFCISLAAQFSNYSMDLWGISSSDYRQANGQTGYTAWGGPPALGPIDGTIVPCATAGSLAFDFADTIHALRWIRGHYAQAWQHYGYVDAFNPLTNWYDGDVLGIDLGISILMAENQRTQFVWNTFMKDPAEQNGMMLAGFQ